MIGQELRQLQEALHRQADSVQREFVAIGEQLKVISRRMGERDADHAALAAEQAALRDRQQTLADAINQWRDRARAVLQQRSDDDLRNYLTALRDLSEPPLRALVEHVLFLLTASDEELAQLAQTSAPAQPTTPAGRLLERARIEFDLRGSDPAPRQRAASEFANRPNVAQDDAIVAELEAALEAPDPIIKEIALLTVIQLHRFRALRLADLDVAQASVERLTQINHPAVIPTLVAILENVRTGFAETGGDVSNRRARLMVLECLVRWHTAEARRALQARQQDRDFHIAEAARRALADSPGEWAGPLQ
jgi:hypothetical protein